METQTEERKVNPSREALKELSRALHGLVESGQFSTVNEAVINTAYKNEQHQEFKKFSEWKQEGRRIIKGSKGFPVWARPKEIKKDDHPDLECSGRIIFNLHM
jgi:hypothetical protein